MKQSNYFLTSLQNCALFNEIENQDLTAVLGCIQAKQQPFEKGQIIFQEGQVAKYIGIVLEGSVRLEQTDYDGNRNILTTVFPSELFGESFACAETEQTPITAIAAEQCTLLLLDCKKMTSVCSNACTFHNQMILNLLKIIATKNIFLNQKAEMISKRTTREKLMTYLFLEAKKRGKSSFTIPFDRQALADYLAVDRSGLSAEISKLRAEGIIESKRNHFRLL